MDAKRRLITLKEEWKDCTRCGLSEGRHTRIVFGAGATSPRFLFVYDVPSEADAELATPMAGEAGTYLLEIMEAAGIDMAHSYCTPVLGCRPTALIPKTDDMPERLVDRAAKKGEVEACRPRLQEIIYLTDPQLIFALGELSWKVLIEPKDRGVYTSLDKAIGEPMVTYIPGRLAQRLQYAVVPLPSIKQLIASPSMARHGTGGLMLRHLEKGEEYVAWLKKSEQADLADGEES